MPDPRFCARCGSALVAAADPAHKPECPACGWFRATNALPVALVLACTAEGKILYTRQRGWPEDAWGLVAREPRVVRTLEHGELLLICVAATIDDAVPRAGSDVDAVRLCAPDLALTPAGWPARTFIEAQLANASS
ncbi:MAG: hypothetical protein AUI58_02085 [Chloroflexi bacterium 13_1_40CM_2_70_6]|nr:MAG: hypothetical protein AUI58_02085 [Chloroflexi bacterium 13_1_40CM_2_70_6]